MINLEAYAAGPEPGRAESRETSGSASGICEAAARLAARAVPSAPSALL